MKSWNFVAFILECEWDWMLYKSMDRFPSFQSFQEVFEFLKSQIQGRRKVGVNAWERKFNFMLISTFIFTFLEWKIAKRQKSFVTNLLCFLCLCGTRDLALTIWTDMLSLFWFSRKQIETYFNVLLVLRTLDLFTNLVSVTLDLWSLFCALFFHIFLSNIQKKKSDNWSWTGEFLFWFENVTFWKKSEEPYWNVTFIKNLTIISL